MNATKQTLSALALTLGIALVVAVGCSKPTEEAKPVEGAKQAAGTNQVAKYTCPMHPEVVQDKAGKCPKCEMALVEKK